ncbi:palmitoyltransferase ZDHHC18-A isoform X2 [Neoarius graeffei]|uniref:palmitoyltransferase ZDHHC18-A isoform X2 n=1 Tax=Neoarius graeffei TaxID=443677 RepID=UPI00298C9317|nr:palmitoyltransferase ZDHHC18-A isoform X2 [Neoarius graeffei]
MLISGIHAKTDVQIIVRFAAFTRVLALILQVLTRFLASSTPVIYWISGHILLSCEPLLKENKNFAYGQRQNTLGQSIYHFWTRHLCIGNPITQLLMCWRTCSFPTHCILGYFISYWLLGLALHCNFLPWT